MLYNISIILPKYFNSGDEIPENYFKDLENKFLTKFGGFSRYSIRGGWRDSKGKVYEENNWKYELMHEAPDTSQIKEYLLNLKNKLKKELHQLDILITITPMSTLI